MEELRERTLLLDATTGAGGVRGWWWWSEWDEEAEVEAEIEAEELLGESSGVRGLLALKALRLSALVLPATPMLALAGAKEEKVAGRMLKSSQRRLCASPTTTLAVMLYP